VATDSLGAAIPLHMTSMKTRRREFRGEGRWQLGAFCR
jgi:hypothetical protein